ncbi:MAG: HutD family protein [Pseudoxanthomonas sp.]
METQSHVIPASEYRRVRWKNGLGWTREIARGNAQPGANPASSENWDWRLSIAEIEQDSAFSSFPGIDRELALLQGHGLRLRFDEGEVRELSLPGQRCRFAGERGVTGELIDGPTLDFNLMWRRGVLAAELLHRPLVGTMVFFTEPGTQWALYLLAGQASFDGDSGLPPLAAGDTTILASGQGRKRHALEGGGELLVMKLARL